MKKAFNMKKKYGLFVTSLIFSIFFNVQVTPLSERMANMYSLAGGSITSVVCGGILYILPTNIPNTPPLSPTNKKIICSTFGVTMGCLVGYTLKKHLYGLTPAGKLEAAAKILNAAYKQIDKIAYKRIISKNFNTAKDLERYANIEFSTSWPLVKTRQHLFNLRNRLTYTYKMINNVRTQVVEDPKIYSNLLSYCETMTAKLAMLQEQINIRIELLSDQTLCDSYKFQVSLYEKSRAKINLARTMKEEYDKNRRHYSQEKEKNRGAMRQLASQGSNVNVSLNI